MIRICYYRIKVGCTHVVLFDPTDSKYIFLRRIDTKKMYLLSIAIIYFFCGVLCRDNYPQILSRIQYTQVRLTQSLCVVHLSRFVQHFHTSLEMGITQWLTLHE